MISLPIINSAGVSSGFVPVGFCATPVAHCRLASKTRLKQRGVVLFLTLIALLAMSLAAVALIRSVDTNSMIAGNIAYKQETITSAEVGMIDSMAWLNMKGNADLAIMLNGDPTLAHTFNKTDLAANRGYHSSILTTRCFTNDALWNSTDASVPVEDDSGTKTSYIIERMCRLPNADLAHTDCLSITPPDNGGRGTDDPKLTPGSPPQMRVTIRAENIRDHTVSYVQGFIF
jgi:type IV pilus assembly protein PilX